MSELNTLKENINNDSLEAYRNDLKNSNEVINLNNSITFGDIQSVLDFGKEPSMRIAEVSDNILADMKTTDISSGSEMINKLNKIMNKFDIEDFNGEDKKGLIPFFKNNVNKVLKKYENIGKEIDSVYILLKKYEEDIHKNNENIRTLKEEILTYINSLEKYISSTELAIEEIKNNKNINEKEAQTFIDALSVNVVELLTSENIGVQSLFIIESIEVGNYNLLRKINSSFNVTLPVFKQCIVQALSLKKQAIEAKALNDLDDVTNKLIIQNSQLARKGITTTTKMANTSFVSSENLEKAYKEILQGIKENKQIQDDCRRQNEKDIIKLKELKKHKEML